MIPQNNNNNKMDSLCIKFSSKLKLHFNKDDYFSLF